MNNSYLTTVDNSPILDALKLWRQATILHHLNRSAALSPDFLNKSPSAISSPRYLSPSPSRPSSPVMSDDEEDRKTDTTPPTSADESDEVRQKPKPKPTSSSWVRWWSRSKKETTAPTPNLESIASDSVLVRITH
jgi:phosphatidate phosphatase LPIN